MPLDGYDVVHAHLSVVAPFTGPLAARASRAGVPTMVTVHSLWNGLGPLPGVTAELQGLRGAPVLWSAVSRVAADQLRRQLPGDPVVPVLSNAVEVDPRDPRPTPAAGAPVRLVSTMRIARRKRPLQLLSMVDSLRRCVDVPFTLTVVGDGPLRPRLERQLRLGGLGGAVRVTGRLAPAEVLETLAASDVYVAPATLESFGLAALEAREVGLPVVAMAASGVTEFVRHGVEGLLCRSDADMVAQLAILLRHPVVRDRMAEHNRTVPAGLTWAHALGQHDAAYALARGARRPTGLVGSR